MLFSSFYIWILVPSFFLAHVFSWDININEDFAQTHKNLVWYYAEMHLINTILAAIAAYSSRNSNSFLCMEMWLCENLCECDQGASEEKGSCGMKLKALETVQICRTPTTEERLNKSTEVWQWDMKGRKGSEHRERRHTTGGRHWTKEVTVMFIFYWDSLR